jgi:hypothetical protein
MIGTCKAKGGFLKAQAPPPFDAGFLLLLPCLCSLRMLAFLMILTRPLKFFTFPSTSIVCIADMYAKNLY